MNAGELETIKLYNTKALKYTDKTQIIKSKDKNNPCKLSRVKREFSHMGFMCGNCYNYNIIKWQFKISTLICDNSLINETYASDLLPSIKYEDGCPDCGKYSALIEIDPNIVETISILNKKKYYTKFCCEGHENKSNPYIYFDNNVKYIPGFIESLMYDLPITWYLDTEDLKRGNIIIRSDYCNHDEAMLDILNWARNLKPKPILDMIYA